MFDLTDARLRTLHARIESLGSEVTSFQFAAIAANYEIISGSDSARLAQLGISLEGRPDCMFLVQPNGRSYGNVKIRNRGSDSVVLLGPPHVDATYINLRLWGNRAAFVAPDMSRQRCNINDVFLRSDDQLCFFGAGATCVGCSVEVHGAGRVVAIGDDCMLSSGIWFRNYDMHAIFDLASGDIINGGPVDIVVERHVWMAQDVLILAAPRLGRGGVIGARALVREQTPPCGLLVGVPARVVRTNVGWSRAAEVVLPMDRDAYAFWQEAADGHGGNEFP